MVIKDCVIHLYQCTLSPVYTFIRWNCETNVNAEITFFLTVVS